MSPACTWPAPPSSTTRLFCSSGGYDDRYTLYPTTPASGLGSQLNATPPSNATPFNPVGAPGPLCASPFFFAGRFFLPSTPGGKGSPSPTRRVSDLPFASVTRTVNHTGPSTAALPDSNPFVRPFTFSDPSARPAGSSPSASSHFKGSTPPVASNHSRYAAADPSRFAFPPPGPFTPHVMILGPVSSFRSGAAFTTFESADSNPCASTARTT